MKRHYLGTIAAILAVLAVCPVAARADIQLGPVITPGADYGIFYYDVVTDGQLGSGLTWSGGETGTTLQVWHGWTGGWEMLADGVDSTLEYLEWDSIGGSWAPGGTHYFTAWARDGEGDWSYVQPHGPVTVLHRLDHFWFSELGGDFGALGERDYALDVEVIAGQEYTIGWDCWGSQEELVQLWAGTGDGWQMLGEIPVAGSETGSYVWDTTGMEQGVYAITAWGQEGGRSQIRTWRVAARCGRRQDNRHPSRDDDRRARARVRSDSHSRPVRAGGQEATFSLFGPSLCALIRRRRE